MRQDALEDEKKSTLKSLKITFALSAIRKKTTYRILSTIFMYGDSYRGCGRDEIVFITETLLFT